ncbi:MAG TPA: hypothetical protein DD671_17225 [Balneolaceae bacterium]|nr:hypothetical protein [Balneolaceae bacterium]
MPHFLKILFVGSCIAILVSSCAATEEATSKSAAPASDVPAWFISSGFSSDSLAFHGYATAIEADSVIAIANARLQAKATLETALAKQLEEIREELGEGGNSTVTQTDFILTLRNAHQQVEEKASGSNGKAVQKEGHYLGYSRVSISKADFRSLMNSGFSGKNAYRSAFLESAAFRNLVN